MAGKTGHYFAAADPEWTLAREDEGFRLWLWQSESGGFSVKEGSIGWECYFRPTGSVNQKIGEASELEDAFKFCVRYRWAILCDRMVVVEKNASIPGDHFVSVSDSEIVEAAAAWVPLHRDAPRDADLVDLMLIIKERRKGSLAGGDLDLLNLHWLRNQFVRLRKAGKMK